MSPTALLPGVIAAGITCTFLTGVWLFDVGRARFFPALVKFLPALAGA